MPVLTRRFWPAAWRRAALSCGSFKFGAAGGFIIAMVAAVLLGSIGRSAAAATVADLYEAVLPLGASQDAAFAEALRMVVVRVSGRRDAAARLGGALGSPRRYVQRFGQTTDGLLQIRFDDVSIDRLLIQSGLPIWGHERPAILILLDMEADEDVRSRISEAARERGLPVKWPVMDDQARLVNEPSQLRLAAARHGANAVLSGRWQGAMVHWVLLFDEGEADASGGWEEGVNLAADTFARLFAVSGSALEGLSVEVSGIAGLDAYAATLNYLEGLTLVRSVALEQVVGDTMHFRLMVRGDAATLRRAISLDDKLVPQGASATVSTASLAFRYRP